TPGARAARHRHDADAGARTGRAVARIGDPACPPRQYACLGRRARRIHPARARGDGAPPGRRLPAAAEIQAELTRGRRPAASCRLAAHRTGAHLKALVSMLCLNSWLLLTRSPNW